MREPVWVETSDALALHVQLLLRHDGVSVLGDEELLKPPYARPDIVEMATAYMAGIVQNHPFVDGNKRTGFVVGVLFLEMNGFAFTAPEAEAAQAVLELAAGSIDETGFALFLRDHTKRARKRAK